MPITPAPIVGQRTIDGAIVVALTPEDLSLAVTALASFALSLQEAGIDRDEPMPVAVARLANGLAGALR